MVCLGPLSHTCAYPDEACSACESGTYADIGNHSDCPPEHCPYKVEWDRRQAEAVADIRRPKPLYSGPHGDYTIHPAGECDDCTPKPPRRVDIVVHQPRGDRCCRVDGCRPSCRW